MAKPRKKLVADFETTTDPRDCRVWASCMYDIEDKKIVHLSNNIDDFMEVLVSARFSKIKDFVNSVEQLGKLAIAMEKLTDEQILDQKTRFAVEGISALSQYKQSKAVSCVFEFEDG